MRINFIFPLMVAVATFFLGAQYSVAGEHARVSEQRWTGSYVGVYLGHHNIDTAGVFDGVELGVLPVLDPIGDKGLHGGFHVGYMRQWGFSVFGIEADYSIGNFDESFEAIQDGSATEAGLLSYPIRGDLDYLATVSARAGISFDGPHNSNLLVYATAGRAFTEFTMDIATGRSKVGFTDTGMVYGGGIEVALSHRLSLRAEYAKIYFRERLDISDVSVSGVFDANNGNYVTLDDIDRVRLAVSFRPFN